MLSFKTSLCPVVLSLQQLPPLAPVPLPLPPMVPMLCPLVLVQSFSVRLLSCSKRSVKEVVINNVFVPFHCLDVDDICNDLLSPKSSRLAMEN
jgi:hypothetical protein